MQPKLHTTIRHSQGGFDFTVTVQGRPLVAGWMVGSRSEVLAEAEAEALAELLRRRAIQEALAERDVAEALAARRIA